MTEWKSRPGETPLNDISGLILKGDRSRKRVADAEAENIRVVLLKYLAAKPSMKLAPFDYAWALKLHKEMYGKVWRWAGSIRQEDLNIGVPHQHVEASLYQLMGNLKCWNDSGMDIHEQAVRPHHEAVRIHPFKDGNGRWARMLENIWLKGHGQPTTTWPEDLNETESPIRGEYIAALQAADNGDFTPLMDLHSRHNKRGGA